MTLSTNSFSSAEHRFYFEPLLANLIKFMEAYQATEDKNEAEEGING